MVHQEQAKVIRKTCIYILSNTYKEQDDDDDVLLNRNPTPVLTKAPPGTAGWKVLIVVTSSTIGQARPVSDICLLLVRLQLHCCNYTYRVFVVFRLYTVVVLVLWGGFDPEIHNTTTRLISHVHPTSVTEAQYITLPQI